MMCLRVYLCGFTENLRYSNTAIDKLHLSDEAVAELMSGKLNTRLLSEIITHPDFAEILAALEVYIDRTVSEKMDITNKVVKIAIDKVKKKSAPAGCDEIITTLNESIIDGDDYIRFRVTRSFDELAQSLYDTHRKGTQAEADGGGLLKMFSKQLSRYEDTKEETGIAEEAKLAVAADQWGVDMKKATDEEKKTLLSFFSRSKFAQFFKKRK